MSETQKTSKPQSTKKDQKAAGSFPGQTLDGPVTKPKEDLEMEEPENDIQILVDRIMVLELALAKFATLSGHGNYLREFGLKRWEPSQKDMQKYG